MTKFCSYLNRLQSVMDGVKFSSYIKDKERPSLIIGVNCVSGSMVSKKRSMEVVEVEIKKKGYPLLIEGTPDTNHFKVVLKDKIQNEVNA
jgi:hypothetical protein